MSEATCGCEQTLFNLAAKDGTDIKVSDQPLSNPYGYEDLGLICPHGVRWYAIPTALQIAKYRRGDFR